MIFPWSGSDGVTRSVPLPEIQQTWLGCRSRPYNCRWFACSFTAVPLRYADSSGPASVFGDLDVLRKCYTVGTILSRRPLCVAITAAVLTLLRVLLRPRCIPEDPPWFLHLTKGRTIWGDLDLTSANSKSCYNILCSPGS